MGCEVDYLIAGQGLAGTALAWRARERGRSVLLADPAPETNASRVAAGIVNPFLGPRLNLQWRYRELWASARPFYRALESRLGTCLLYELPLVRYFTDEGQRTRWRGKRERAEVRDLWKPFPEDPDAAFLCPGAAWLDTTAYLSASASALPMRRERIDPGEIAPTPDGVAWRDVRARFLVFCEGTALRANPWFSFLPLRAAMGDILGLRVPGQPEDRILHRGKWLVPVGGGLFRAGSTFDWDAPTAAPSPAAAKDILDPIRPLLAAPPEPVPELARAGFRPLLAQGRPALGRHPEQPRLAALNGLGAKGVLLSPFFADRLLDALERNASLDPEVDLVRFWNR